MFRTSEKASKSVRKNFEFFGRTFEKAPESGITAATKIVNPRLAAATALVLINFVHQGKGIN